MFSHSNNYLPIILSSDPPTEVDPLIIQKYWLNQRKQLLLQKIEISKNKTEELSEKIVETRSSLKKQMEELESVQSTLKQS